MKNKQTILKTNQIASLLFVLFVALSSFTGMHAQSKTIKGVVTGSVDGMPIPGVTVLIKGTNKGTTTDFDGAYIINASLGEELAFYYVGMTTKIIKILSSEHNVVLSSDVEDLEEVVVIGYGTVKKKELTGAVSQVKAADIENFVTQDLASALQGQVSGVNITASTGEPGEGSSIQIRGITSLTGTNTPLFVVDGIPQEGDPRLSPNEIETIDILKDAASAAVYGTRGAAGVILITTKRGKEGSMSISVDVSQGFQFLGNGVPLMNTVERLRYEVAKYDLGTPDAFNPGPHRNPDWLNNDNSFTDLVLTDGAETRQYNLNVSGGTKNFSYNLVGGYFDQEGTLINSGFKRYNSRASTSYKSGNWEINGSLAASLEKRVRTSNSLIVSAIRYPSYFPRIDPLGDVVYTTNLGTSTVNNFASNLRRKDDSSTDRVTTNISVTRRITDALRFTTRMGGTVINSGRDIFVPKYTEVEFDTGESNDDPTRSSVSAYSLRRTNFTWEGMLNFRKRFGDHNLGALASMSVGQNKRKEFTATRQGVLNNSVKVLNGATINPDAFSGFNYTSTSLGFLGRLQYDYQGKYLMSFVVRKDGSSKFSEENRWGVFPSSSFAWNISDEEFWQPIKSTVSNFRFRASLGTVGNESFNDYEYDPSIILGSDYIFSAEDVDVSYGTAIRSYANQKVKWETSIQQNFGIDLGLFKNKITLTADYYSTEKKDMLFPVRLAGSAGSYYDPTVTSNVGDMTNKGLELAARYRERIGKSRFDISTTFTKNTNEITRMEGDVNLIYNSNSALLNGDPASVITVLAEGYEAGAFFLYETNGVITDQAQLDTYRQYPSRVNAELGDLIYVDHNNDGDINEEDRHYAGSGLPDFEFGVNFKWTYKSFDLAMNWYGTVGSEIVNGSKAAAFAVGNHKALANMWTPANVNSQIPLHTGDNKSGSYNYRGFTDMWLENGDYLRLKLISLGYNVPKKINERLGLSNLRFFISAQNPITLTNYSGYDPEIGGNVTRRGLDASRYPLTALYTIGLKLKL
jgi:TonB-linked SusC/RagA family outer membrane protein